MKFGVAHPQNGFVMSKLMQPSNSTLSEHHFPFRVLVFGSTGQVGSALRSLVKSPAAWISRQHADFTKPEVLPKVLDQHAPDFVVNLAADTNVDRAEDTPEETETVNCTSPATIARWCAVRDVPFFHVSTDFVFGHSDGKVLFETDSTNPLNVYGRSKLNSERAVLAENGKACVFRAQWVYSDGSENFASKMLKLGTERETLQVVSDQTGAPTYAHHLAKAIAQLIASSREQQRFPSGIFHLTAQGNVSRFEWVSELFRQARDRGIDVRTRNLVPVSSEVFPTKAIRPKHLNLSNEKVFSTFGVQLPDWKAGISDLLDDLIPKGDS